jgi:hypothetical protein
MPVTLARLDVPTGRPEEHGQAVGIETHRVQVEDGEARVELPARR